MKNLEPYERRAANELCAITQMSQSNAVMLLRSCDWDVSMAIDLFYSGGLINNNNNSSSRREKKMMDPVKLEAWFKNYEDDTIHGTIQVDGILKFCEDLGLNPEDPAIIVISKYFEAKNMFVFTKEEFLHGMQEMSVDSVDELKKKIPDLTAELENSETFGALYKFTFGWACPEGQKSMQCDTAVSLWRLLLQNKFKYIEEWCTYVESLKRKVISRDEWQLVLEFALNTSNGLDGYDENEAWPVLIDEFVDRMRN